MTVKLHKKPLARVTLKDIATEVGVSVQTVSNILNGRMQQTRRGAVDRATRIRSIAAELGYRPNWAARAMRRSRSMQIGVLLRNDPVRPIPYVAAFEMVLGINAALDQAGYVLSLVRVEEVSGDKAPTTPLFKDQLLDGMIVMDSFPDGVHRRVESIFGKRVVWLEGDVWRDTQCVRRDEWHTGVMAGDRLAALGYRRALWIGTTDLECNVHFSVAQRYGGLEQACRAHGLPLDHSEPVERTEMAAELSGLGALLRPGTAVVAYDALMALLLMHNASALGLRAGSDFGLICCDEDQMTLQSWPSLSRISNNRFALGQQATEMLLKILEDPSASPSSRLVRGQWVSGGTAPPIEPPPAADLQLGADL